MNIISLLAVAASAFVITFLSGFVVLRALATFSTEECWAFSGAAGCALLATIASAAFLAHNFQRLFYVDVLLVIMFLCMAIIRLRKIPVLYTKPPRWITYILLFWVVLISIQCITPVYTGAFMYGDWWMHYDISLFFRGLKPLDVTYFGQYSIPSRTPFFNLFVSFFLAIFKDQFAVYQMVTVIPGIALIGILIAFIRKTKTGLFILFFNPFIVAMILFPWPKIPAATYSLAGIYSYIQWRNTESTQLKRSLLIASGFWQGLAILTHPSAFFYTLGIFLDNIFSRESYSNRLFRMVLPIGIIISAVVFPWFLWVINNYGIQSLLQASPIVAGNGRVLLGEWLLDRVINFGGTLLPLPAFNIFLKDQQFWSEVHGLDIWLRFYYAVLPGACTLTASLVLWRYFKQKNMEAIQTLPLRTFGIISLVGFVCGVIFQPGFNIGGVVGESMTPIVLIVLILTIKIVDNLTALQQKKIMLFTFIEFFATRGIQIIIYIFGSVPESDTNMILKSQYHLVFAQDIVGTFRFIFVCIIIAGCALMLRNFLGTAQNSNKSELEV